VSRTYYWDFFGPRAEGTARHFHVHLLEFLAKNACPEMPTGLESQGARHYAVFCHPPDDWQTPIEQSLRPRRAVEG
jgi:hypothetical protein